MILQAMYDWDWQVEFAIFPPSSAYDSEDYTTYPVLFTEFTYAAGTVRNDDGFLHYSLDPVPEPDSVLIGYSALLLFGFRRFGRRTAVRNRSTITTTD